MSKLSNDEINEIEALAMASTKDPDRGNIMTKQDWNMAFKARGHLLALVKEVRKLRSALQEIKDHEYTRFQLLNLLKEL